jgi:ribosomal protein S18 acetylase RimI-like enzyme
VTERDAAEAIATIVAAFAEDPVERWMYPADEDYAAHFPRFVAAFAGDGFAAGTVDALAGLTAVAVWHAPGAPQDGDAIVAVLAETVAPELHDDLFAVLGQMDAAHPAFEHWYLPWLAVRPGARGAGLGERLLAHGLARADAQGVPVYLETPNPRAVPLYERHGFEVVAIAQAGSCPPITSMLRGAR